MVVVPNGGRAHFMIYLECAAVRRLTAALNAVLCIAVVVDDAPCRIRIQSPIIEARSGVFMHVKCSAPAQHRLPLGLSSSKRTSCIYSHDSLNPMHTGIGRTL